MLTAYKDCIRTAPHGPLVQVQKKKNFFKNLQNFKKILKNLKIKPLKNVKSYLCIYTRIF